MNNLIDNILVTDNLFYELLILSVVFLAVFALFAIVSRFVFNRLRKIVKKTDNHIDDYIVKLFQSPILLILFSILLMSFTPAFIERLPSLSFFKPLSSILLTLSVGWFVIQLSRAVSKYFQNKYNISAEDNLIARSRVTQIRMFENIAIFLLWLQYLQ